MTGKKVMLIVLILLLTLSAASAADSNTTDLSADDSVEIISTNTSQDTLAKTTTVSGNTFADIQKAINSARDGDTIELSGTYSGSGKSISIDKELSIYGKSDATLDAKGLSGIFTPDSDSLILKNIKFTNTNNKAIDYCRNCQITDCEFENCHSERYAGALFLSSISKVSDCKFINCTAGVGGGAVWGGNIDNCKFIDCSAGEYGGAVYEAKSVRDSTFIGCHVSYHYVIENTPCDNCTFINCSSYNGYIARATNSLFISCNGQLAHGENCTILIQPDDLTKYGNLKGFIVNVNTFNDIQNAIYQAQKGDTIHLFGTYSGNDKITINKPGLTIEGHDAILNGKNLEEILTFDLSTTESNNMIKNIKFVNAEIGIYIPSQCRGNRIINATFENFKYEAILASYDYYSYNVNSATDCTFISCSRGSDHVNVANSTYIDCMNCISDGNAINCNFTNCEDAISQSENVSNCIFTDCHGNTITGSTAYACTFISCDDNPISEGRAYYCIFKNTKQNHYDASLYRHAIIEITQESTHYRDNCLKVKLTDTDSNIAIENEFLRLDFSNGKWDSIITDENGIATCNMPFDIGSYSATASVEDERIDCEKKTFYNAKITKAPATITAKKLKTTYKVKNKFTVCLTNSETKRAISDIDLILKVYTGSKCKTYNLKTDANGKVSISTKDISVGKHKVIITSPDSNLSLKAKQTSIVVSKPSVKLSASNKVTLEGIAVKGKKIILKDKKSKKALIGVKVKFKIYTAKNKYKTYTLTTGNDGSCSLVSTKFTAGTHKLVISSGDKSIKLNKKTTIKISKYKIDGAYRTVGISGGRIVYM